MLSNKVMKLLESFYDIEARLLNRYLPRDVVSNLALLRFCVARKIKNRIMEDFFNIPLVKEVENIVSSPDFYDFKEDINFAAHQVIQNFDKFEKTLKKIKKSLIDPDDICTAQLQWIDIYFPKYKDAYSNLELEEE